MSLTMIEDREKAGAVWEKWKLALLGRRRVVLGEAMKVNVSGASYGFRLFENKGHLNCEMFPWDIYSAAVQINKPNGGPHGDTRAAMDDAGNCYIAHRARLMKNNQGPAVAGDDFFAHTGLQRTGMIRRLRPHEDNWSIIAQIDGRTASQIRVDTIAFVRACWNARLAGGNVRALERLADLGLEVEGLAGLGGNGLIGAHQRNITGGTQVVDPTHDKVVTAMRELLEPAGRWIDPPALSGFQPDVIACTGIGRVLIEIKSRRDAGSMHGGIGQLMFYPVHLKLEVASRVLLVPEKPDCDSKLRRTLEQIDIELHVFTEGNDGIVFEPALLKLLGLAG